MRKTTKKKKDTGNKRDPETTHTSHALVMLISNNVKMAEKGKRLLRDELMYETNVFQNLSLEKKILY